MFSLEDSKVNYTYKVNDRIHSLDMATNSSHYAVAFASGKIVLTVKRGGVNLVTFSTFVNDIIIAHGFVK